MARQTFRFALWLFLLAVTVAPSDAQQQPAVFGGFSAGAGVGGPAWGMLANGPRFRIPNPILRQLRSVTGLGAAGIRVRDGVTGLPQNRPEIRLGMGAGFLGGLAGGFGAGSAGPASMILATECLFQSSLTPSSLGEPLLPGPGVAGRPWGFRAGVSYTPFPR
jgi:hypothetical protein